MLLLSQAVTSTSQVIIQQDKKADTKVIRCYTLLRIRNYT